ncbi:Multidrug resistance operon repressor [Aquisphaera giovannonii]|uniref:Multidrug resistance operon repressor n=1 Tax=Aquisphaera giovannonii TaxID=406548 RepID=A0A5B9WAR9_9BACT|nr:MarR family transcriptional regulator [Aquisphaera giovannonii]QEH37632.1 Multidrug resistance operon repressor [Aquisphaera giovannonii]
MPRHRSSPEPSPASWDGIGFLLSQVASHSSARFAAGLEPLGLKPSHAGILRVIGEADGSSQQSLGERLGVFASRLVGLIDDLESRGFVERRDNPSDRRSYALHLTPAGREALAQISGLSRRLEGEVFASLDASERARMADFLRRIAAQQGLRPGVHPGIGKSGGPDSEPAPPRRKARRREPGPA